MHHRSRPRSNRLVVASLTALAAVAACQSGGTPEAVGDDPSPESVLADARAAVRGAQAPTLPDGRHLRLSETVRDFYLETSGSSPLWATPDGLTEAGRALMGELERLEMEGVEVHLVSTDGATGRPVPDSAELDPGILREVAPEIREVALSQAFVSAARHILEGRLDPDTIVDGGRDLHADAPLKEGLLQRIADGDSPVEVLDSLRPEMPWYARSVAAVETLHEVVASGGWPTIEVPVDSVYERGDSSYGIRTVRARLAAGLAPNEQELVSDARMPDVYDAELEEAVRSFQERHALGVDGRVGPETIQALNAPAEERIEALLLSLRRMRWLPNDLGDRTALVNVAGFEMHVLEHGESVLDMHVVVGRPDWPTVLFSDTLDHIVVNPYWHVPESIEGLEILPKVRTDPSYLAANDYVVVPAGDNYGAPVDPGSVDWSDFDGYDIRQEPGPGNALGQMKFMFPNENNIYLHDTPAQHRFEESLRAFSHGCVRVERPHELARYFLEHTTSRDPAELEEILATRERTRVDLDQPVPVHLIYLTAWADEDGRLHVHPDVYDRNERFHEILETQ